MQDVSGHSLLTRLHCLCPSQEAIAARDYHISKLEEKERAWLQSVQGKQRDQERESEEGIRQRQVQMEMDRQAREQAMENVRARMEARVKERGGGRGESLRAPASVLSPGERSVIAKAARERELAERQVRSDGLRFATPAPCSCCISLLVLLRFGPARPRFRPPPAEMTREYDLIVPVTMRYAQCKRHAARACSMGSRQLTLKQNTLHAAASMSARSYKKALQRGGYNTAMDNDHLSRLGGLLLLRPLQLHRPPSSPGSSMGSRRTKERRSTPPLPSPRASSWCRWRKSLAKMKCSRCFSMPRRLAAPALAPWGPPARLGNPFCFLPSALFGEPLCALTRCRRI